MNKKEITLNDQINKLKENNLFYSKENQNLINEKERSNALHQTQLKNLKEDYEMKIITLENQINFQKNQLYT